MTQPSVDNITRKIREKSDEGYFIVTMVHWGTPFQKKLDDYQRPLAYSLIDAGSNLIVGTHPHTLHAIEMIKQTPVLYSIGNFAFSPSLQRTLENIVPESILKDWDMSPRALIPVISFDREGGITLELNPIKIVDGFPSLPNPNYSKKVVEELENLSPTPVPWEKRDNKFIVELS